METTVQEALDIFVLSRSERRVGARMFEAEMWRYNGAGFATAEPHHRRKD
jgi:hypothetical protein